MKSLLIGESASIDVEAAIVAAIEAGPDVERVIHLRTLHVGPETLLVAAKIGVLHDDTAASIAAGIDAAEGRIRAAVPIAELIFLSPTSIRRRALTRAIRPCEPPGGARCYLPLAPSPPLQPALPPACWLPRPLRPTIQPGRTHSPGLRANSEFIPRSAAPFRDDVHPRNECRSRAPLGRAPGPRAPGPASTGRRHGSACRCRAGWPLTGRCREWRSP